MTERASRRAVLSGLGGIPVSASLGRAVGVGESGEFDPGDEAELVLSIEELPGGWRTFEDVDGEPFEIEAGDDIGVATRFVSTDADAEVLSVARVIESIEDAKTVYETLYVFQTARAGSFGDAEIGDDSFWVETDVEGRVVFRESNAIGEVVAIHRVGDDVTPAPSAALEYAELAHDTWAEYR